MGLSLGGLVSGLPMKLIPVTGRVDGKNNVTVAYAKVSDEDYLWASARFWHRNSKGYAVTNATTDDGSVSIFRMHRLILEAAPGEIVDHINRDILDNRRENLRKVTASQNAINRRPNRERMFPTGVRSAHRSPHRYEAYIKRDGVYRHLGTFTSIEEAAEARAKAEELYFGEYRPLS